MTQKGPTPKKAKPPTRTVDLDARLRQSRAARDAARAEAQQERVSIRVAGVDYELPVEMPFELLDAQGRLAEGEMAAIRPALEAMLGPKAAPAVIGLGLSVDDALDLLEAVSEAYGVDVGEAPASSGS